MIDALEAAAWAVAGAAAVGALRRRLRRSAKKPALRRFPATAKFDDIWEAYERDGAVIVEDMLSPETLAKLRDETEASFRATAPGTAADDADVAEFWGGNTKRFTRLAARSRTFLDRVLVHPLLLRVADAELLPHCAQYWMNTGQMMCIGPGSRAQWLHRDAENWGHFCDGPKSIPVTVSCMFAVTDFKAETGATRVAPGSHGWRDFRTEARPDQILQAEMKSGSGLIYSGKVVHSGGANATADEWRGAASISFFSRATTPRSPGATAYI